MLRWQADVLDGLAGHEGFRVATPLQARGGAFIVEGWSAFHFVEGSHADDRIAEIVEVGEKFHSAVRHLARPAFLADRSDNWAIADRVAWEELPIDDYLGHSCIARLAEHRRPINEVSQVIHGDLGGNILFHADLPPAVIDLSPYWRPVAFASAIVVADALQWQDADEGILDGIDARPEFAQHLVRALIFRLGTDQRAGSGRESHKGSCAYAVELACQLADQSQP